MTRAAEAMRQRLEAEDAKLKDRNQQIRERVEAGEPKSALARQYGISRERVAQILYPRSQLAREAAAYRALLADGKAPPLHDEGEGAGR